jgi:hypothetical protein
METTQLPVSPPPTVAPTAALDFQHCDECDALVDHNQRYCVNCGAHRRTVPDPAARYLSQASARSRAVRRAPSGAGTARRQGAGLATALVLALIPVAAVVGVEAGRSSGSQDSKLIQELARARAQTVVSSSPVGSSAGASSNSKSSQAAKKHGKSRRTAAATAGGGKTASSTKYGTATQITGSNVTASQAAQGAAEAKTIQNSTGKNYVQAANNLPTTVVP